ncbi:FdhF/YdeP family oxidoreductase [Chitinimonas sp. BJB300]|uniref:FdhF/YdeP family oxidoreductase n=1 Tax=Chitinimonas sp. BJB300 TaxID=1559339 RepID=UPI000C0C7411|nr:FdhF/YdeP family oxidoreductase [Chitinimonas sp. BJB300]PHV12159.1 CbbBc protein [Chitinimonas sp. BJB300]TSJ90109.1 FdhF/YdeP family oxidoreductase [Chitinimonas sp. BJB300]
MSKQSIKFYNKPAGGWGALRSVFKHLREQGSMSHGVSTLLHVNQPDGFDCPGCAWPDKNHHSTFEFCENGVKAVAAEATERRVSRALFESHTVSQLAAHDDYWLENQGRLTEPMCYDSASQRYVPIDWHGAFALIAQHLNALAHPDQALFYTSGRTSNEAAFLYQLFIREFGTNNLPDCSNMCHEPSGTAMREQIGIGKGTVTLEDFDHAEAIFIFGQNPGTNHPRMLGTLRDAAKRGCRIMVFNPLRERGLERFADPQSPIDMLSSQGSQIASSYYQLKIGGDLAVAKGIAKVVLEAGDVDEAFIAGHTDGFAEFQADVLSEEWATIVEESGLSEAQIREAAGIYIQSAATICTWGMGITQHKHSVATIQAIVNLLLLKGNIGKPGAGACPVRGHSNVQGDRTMGIFERPAQAFLDRLGIAFNFTPPQKHGYDVVGAIEAMLAGDAKVFIGMGGNFAVATPDADRTKVALQQCDLTVNITTKLNRSHLVHGKAALILPCLGRTEIDIQDKGPQGVTVEDSMSMVHISAGMNPPASDRLLSEPAIVAHMALATLKHSKTPWLWLVEDYDRIRDKIAQVVEGFENFNQRVHVPGGFYLGNSARERDWRTATGKARFMAHAVPTDLPIKSMRAQYGSQPVFNLMTVRSHDQYNTTVYGMDDRYRGVFGHRRVCFINKVDLARLGFSAGQWVDMTSVWHDGKREAKRFLLVEYDIPEGCLASYFPETNGLVPLSSMADRARTPASKSIPVILTLNTAETTVA